MRAGGAKGKKWKENEEQDEGAERLGQGFLLENNNKMNRWMDGWMNIKENNSKWVIIA